MRPSLGCFTVGSVRCGLSHLWWRSEFADLYRRMKNLLKLFYAIKAGPRFISQQHNPITH
jgi:hypothetical protein